MIEKLLKIRYAFAVLFLLFAQFALSAHAGEFFAPALLEPQLSGDGNTLINGGPTSVFVHKPKPAGELRHIPSPFNLVAPPKAASSTFSITYIANGGTDLWNEPCYTFPAEAQTGLLGC